MVTQSGPVGVRVNGGKLHVRRPGIRPVARCGQSLRVVAGSVTEHPSDGVPADQRCRNCFPGTAS